MEITIKINLPNELALNKNKILTQIQETAERKAKNIIDCHLEWYQRDQKILKCPHDWDTEYKRTSAYDSEYVTECKRCKVDIETYTEIVKKYK